MKYISTRAQKNNGAPKLNFEDVVLTGLAEDGGLYVPEQYPHFSIDEIKKLKGLPYADLALEILAPFMAPDISRDELKGILDKSYSTFHHPDIAPVKKLATESESDLYLLELFHGPTLAFKDFALQLLGNLFDHILEKRDETLTILGATSGDTGSAAIQGCRGRDRLKIFITHPNGRVSDVQRKQMTTVMDDNVFNIAVDGTFDDCQDLVKALFNDLDFRKTHKLSAINSINWARIVAQVVYYFHAALKAGGPETLINICVPTGNFGNIFAAFVAKKIGLPVNKLIIGSNQNDILTRYFNTGTMTQESVSPSLSPSMDIQISSNFERLMFEMLDRDGNKVTQLITKFREQGSFDLPITGPAKDFMAFYLDDAGTIETIKTAHAETGEILDPHTAVGLSAAKQAAGKVEGPILIAATAHPSKFPDAVTTATGQHPALPDFMDGLLEKEERCDVIENQEKDLKDYITKKLT